jgi:hypothetical protein
MADFSRRIVVGRKCPTADQFKRNWLLTARLTGQQASRCGVWSQLAEFRDPRARQPGFCR